MVLPPPHSQLKPGEAFEDTLALSLRAGDTVLLDDVRVTIETEHDGYIAFTTSGMPFVRHRQETVRRIVLVP